MKVSDNVLRKYAALAVRTGINIQKDQMLVIQAGTESNYFVRLCVQEAYKAGAKKVYVQWNDDEVNRLDYEYQSVETLEEVPEWSLNRIQHYMDEKAPRLSVYAPTPGLLKDIDSEKVRRAQVALQSKDVVKKFRQFSMGNKAQWSLVSIPSVGWATKVFPELDEKEAVDKLWEAILQAVRIDENNDPVLEWSQHNEKLHKQNTILNDYNFKSLHFKNSLGTDLVVGLAKDHIWAGGSEVAANGFEFNPNLPTEESFTMPDKNNVNGIVYSTKPLNYGGRLIDEFWLRFEDGKVVEHGAKKEEEALTNLLNFDEGSRRIGEIALISHDSPISNSNILFLNTLFDENASCHMALGAAYPMNIKGGLNMTEEELSLTDANRSSQHEDFMFGSHDMKIVGETFDGQQVLVFENGDFVF
ncbi:MAG: aminopeptidase [Erysipelothrix sp.]|nr:aminopeptidase [Erysipelothrix sp.]